MNLSFSEEDLKFQDEVRSFIADNYPAEIKNKMDNGIPVSKDDILTWQRILSKKGWFAINWPGRIWWYRLVSNPKTYLSK